MKRFKKNYEDLASGRVLYNAHGTTSFPVRLASEILQRCFGILESKGVKAPYSIYDPCCGGAYLLTTAGLLHGDKLSSVYASDINSDVLQIAEQNLSLLSAGGLHQRKEQIKEYIRLYDKASHKEALISADKLSGNLSLTSIGKVSVFPHDITNASPGSELPHAVNIVITDLPYGDIVTWKSESENPLTEFFEHVYEHLAAAQSVLAVIADKKQKLQHEKFKRIDLSKAGKRQFAIFEPIKS